MGVTLDQQEIDDFLTKGYTLIVSTLDKNGYPHTTPVWYVYFDGYVSFRIRGPSHKARNLARDSKLSVLVETGERWKDLKAVMIRGRAEVITDKEVQARFDETLDSKYATFKEARSAMPTRTQQHYEQTKVYYKVIPEKKITTWDNQKIRMAPRA